jgi:PAS domain S-box-containing protein
MKNKSLKSLWIIIIIAALLVAVVLILGNQSFIATEKVAFNEFNQRQLVLAREAAGVVESFFDNLVADPMFEIATDENYPAPSGQFAGVVLSTLKLDAMTQKFVAPIQASARGHEFLIDDEHDVLWSPDSSLSGKNDLAASEGVPPFQQTVERMNSGNIDTAKYSYYKFEDIFGAYTKDETEQKLIDSAPIHLGKDLWAVGLWAPKEDARQLIQAAYSRQLFVVGLTILIILLGSFIALFVSYRFGKSLEKEVETKVGELRESEDRYRRLVELSPDAIGIHSEDKIVFMNSAGVELFGAESREQLIGKSVWDFVPPENREIVKERYRQMREEGTQLPPIEQRFIRLDGTYVDVEVSATSFVYKGKPAMQTLFHDITERKQAEDTLQAAYAFLQSIIDGVAHPIMVIDADYRVKMMNRAAREFSYGGIASSEPVYCYQVSHQCEAPCSGSEHPCPMEQVRQSGQPVTVVHQHYQANGEPRFVEIVASPLWEADGTFQGIIESIRDVTNRQEAKEMLAQQAQGLIHAEDELGQFANKVVKSLQDFFGKLPSD